MDLLKLLGNAKAYLAAVAILSAPLLTSCDDMGDDDEDETITYTFTFESSLSFDENGMWSQCYDTDVNSITIQSYLMLTHSATVTNYGGEEYKSWTGFAPSRGADTYDHSAEGWINYQWSSIAGCGATSSMDYLICCWNVDEPTDALPSEPSLGISLPEGTTPLAVAISNSSWGYYAMLNGSDYNRAFGSDDWCKVIFKSIVDRAVVSTVEVYLARNGVIESDWVNVDLSPLGETSYILVQMESSDSGAWGMNNPAYFCLDNLRVQFTYKSN